MSVVELSGDIFTTEADAIGHGVNVDGLFGSGIALQVREKCPVTHSEYRALCAEGGLAPGSFQAVYEPSLGKTIVNLASQDRPGPAARLEWLRASLDRFLSEAEGSSVRSLALPRIGAGVGGLEWEDVRSAIFELAEAHPHISIELWTYVPEAD